MKDYREYKDNLSNMMCLDIYLSSLSNADYQKIKHKIKSQKSVPHPLQSYGIINDPVQLFTETDLRALEKFSEKYQWKISLENILNTSYEALVLTDASLHIQWTNAGFTKMTGYPLKQAIGKTPNFLQGPNTSNEVKENIRKKLNSAESFTEEIINYRRNKEEYVCRVTFFQIHNRQHQLTHFLALESETK